VLVNSTDAIVKTAKHDANGFYVPARTTAVFSRISQKSCAPYPVDLFVRGSFSDWADPPKPEYKLAFLGGKDYSVSAPVTLPAQGKPAFKIAGADWNAAATDCGVAPSTNAWLGQPLTLTCGKVPGFDSNINLQVSAAGNYTFSLNAASTVNPVLTVTKSPPVAPTVFVRGGFNGWDASLPMAWDGESIYTSVGSVAAGTFEFKVEAGNWATLDCGGPAGAANGSTKAVIGQPLTLTCKTNPADPGPSNLGITIASAGSYVFAVDASDQAALKLLVEPSPVTNISPPDCTGDTNVFVRGLASDWSCGAANKMNYLGFGTYRLDKVVAPTDVFKIATANWSTVNCGGAADGDKAAIGTPYTLTCGDPSKNLGLATSVGGTYRFKYTKTDGKLLVTGP